MLDVDFWHKMLGRGTPEERSHVVNLAAAQAALEGLKRNPVVGEMIVAPEGRADLASLEALVEAGRLYGIEPDEDLREYARLLVSGEVMIAAIDEATEADMRKHMEDG